MDVFAAVADPARRKILELVAARPVAAGVVADAFADISRPAVSRHLRVLREAGLVHAETLGRRQIYTADIVRVAEVSDWVESLAPAPRFLDHLDALATEIHRARRERTNNESLADTANTSKEQTA